MKEILELANPELWKKKNYETEIQSRPKFTSLSINTTPLAQNYQRFRKHVDLDEDCWGQLNRLKYEMGCKTLSQTIRVLIRRERERQEPTEK